MATTELKVSTSSEGAAATLVLAGDIDRNAETVLNQAYRDAGDATTITLDFNAVDYINSTGIAVIVGLLARARAAGQALVAAGLSPHYREIFEITRLSDFMTIVDQEGKG